MFIFLYFSLLFDEDGEHRRASCPNPFPHHVQVVRERRGNIIILLGYHHLLSTVKRVGFPLRQVSKKTHLVLIRKLSSHLSLMMDSLE